MTVKITVKDKLEDNTLDLSCCDLEDVPVKEIAAIKKGTHLDLSNNQLVRLPETFATLSHIVKLDLSKNLLEELPENIGDLKQLKHLDLYSNKISRLPLSFAELKNLKWLDLKDNPLTEVLSVLAGPCSDNEQCQKCATLVVKYYNTAKKSIAQTKQLAIKAAAAEERKREAKRKRKKKKNAEKNNIIAEAQKEKLIVDKSEESIVDNDTKEVSSGVEETSYRELVDHNSPQDVPDGLCGTFCRKLIYRTVNLVFGLAVIAIIVLLTFTTAPPIDREHPGMIIRLMEDKTGIPFVNLQHECKKQLDLFHQYIRYLWKNIWIFFKDNYERSPFTKELIDRLKYSARYLMNNTRILIMDTYQRHFGEELVDMDDADL